MLESISLLWPVVGTVVLTVIGGLVAVFSKQNKKIGGLKNENAHLRKDLEEADKAFVQSSKARPSLTDLRRVSRRLSKYGASDYDDS
jgi:hypothetical protein